MTFTKCHKIIFSYGGVIMTLEDLYICDVDNTCKAIPDTEEYKETQIAFQKAEEQLLESLTEKQKKLFFSYMDVFNSLLGQEDQERYKRGVATGIRITSEAFLLGKE